jgi:hypothetical protein
MKFDLSTFILFYVILFNINKILMKLDWLELS